MKKNLLTALVMVLLVVSFTAGCGKDDPFQKPDTREQNNPWKDEKLGSIQYVVKRVWNTASVSLINDGDGVSYKLSDAESISVYFVDWTAARKEAQDELNNGKEWSQFWTKVLPWKDSIETNIEKYLTGKLSPAVIKYSEDDFKTDNYKFVKHSGKTTNVDTTYQAEMYYYKIDDYNLIVVTYLFGEKDTNRNDFLTLIKSISVSKE